MPGNPLTDPDWAPKLADTVVRIVGSVRDKTTAKVLTAYRGVIYGLIAAFGGMVIVVLLIIALFRGLQALLDIGLAHHNSVWISYLAIGAIFSLGGMMLMKRRYAPAEEPAKA
ncbi:MAG: hypothetical protein JWM34_2674 [Ilumatobacteraceae bacterium]|nr:hypothetical protein [Ilumatobacteraceae bacterium]